jgi:hypothetical protein
LAETDFIDHFLPRFVSVLVRKLLLQWFLHTAEDSAHAVMYATVASEVKNVSGLYFGNLAPAPLSPEAKNKEVAARLWQESVKITKL